MILINKHINNEPREWIDYKNTPGVIYAPHPALRAALLEEQGYICAFCMRRIPLIKRDPNEQETSKIAHLESRGNNPARWGDYMNLVVCCPGNINGDAHCDKSQGASNVTLSLFNIQVQNSISYGSHTGEIKSANAFWNNEIDRILKLNNTLLKANRREALSGIRHLLEKKKWTKAAIREKYEQWAEKDDSGNLKSYCGIVIWYFGKKLKAA